LTKIFEDATEKMQNNLVETERRYRETDEELFKRITRKLEEFRRAKGELDESATQIESMEMEISTFKRRLRDSEEIVTKAEETRLLMKIQISIPIERQYETLTKLQEDFENSKSRERKLRLEVESLQSHLEGLESNITQVVMARDAVEEESKGLRECLCEADVLAARVPGLENLINGYEEVVLSQKDDISRYVILLLLLCSDCFQYHLIGVIIPSLQDEKLKLIESVDKLQNELLFYQTKFSEKQDVLQKQIDAIKSENEALQKKHDESLRCNTEKYVTRG